MTITRKSVISLALVLFSTPILSAQDVSKYRNFSLRTGDTIALWENSLDSVALSRRGLSNSFQLVLFSKQLNGQAEAAIASAARGQREDAPQREIARVKKEADDLEAMRQTNLKTFQP
jgi:hypothetical protein